MIAGCIERFGRGDCGSCARRDACAFLRFGSDGRDERRKASARPFLRALLDRVARAVESRSRAPRRAFRKEVERCVEPLLESGTVRADRIARALGCSRQTLYRRLKAEGVTFAGLVDALRRRLALRLVHEGRLSVKETAYRLGFSDPAAFSRAFKRWTGSSPRAMQRRGSASEPARRPEEQVAADAPHRRDAFRP